MRYRGYTIEVVIVEDGERYTTLESAQQAIDARIKRLIEINERFKDIPRLPAPAGKIFLKHKLQETEVT